MTYKIIWEPRGAVIQFSGRITSHDSQNASVEYQDDPRFGDLSYVIADYSQITECVALPIEVEDIWAIDSLAKRVNPKLKKAIVSANVTVINMANLYKKHQSHGFPVEIFATQTDARDWVDALQANTSAAPKIHDV